MCQYAYQPPILFATGTGRIWADVVNHLSGYMVRLTFTDGRTVVSGELLGDGNSGRYVRLMVEATSADVDGAGCESEAAASGSREAKSERVFLARSIENLEIL